MALRDIASNLLASARSMFAGAYPQPARAEPTLPPLAENGMRPTVGFDLGKTGRRLAAIPSSTTSINTLIQTYGRNVLGRSRYLCANNPYAVSAKEAFVSAMVGFGVKPSTLGETKADKKAVQELWRDWVDEADADGLQDFYGLQSMAASELFEAGEVFAVELDAPRNATVPLRYRMLPSEMLPMVTDFAPSSQPAPGNYIYMGIEFNPQGERVAYHFYKRNPNEIHPTAINDIGTERIPAESVMHLYRPIRAGQVRGVPFTLSALITLAMLDLYDDAELERKRVAALFAAFVTKNPQEGSTPDHPLGLPANDPSPATTSSFGLESGAIIDLMPGENVAFSAPADVGNSYEQFQYRQLLRAAAGFGVPYAEMTGDLRQANYGSIRAGLVAFRRRVTSMQYHVLIFQFCRPVWIRWNDMAARLKLLPWTFSQYMKDRALQLRVQWLQPKWEWVDPAKDIAAEVEAINNGLKARSDSIEEQGYDPEETDDRIVADMEREATFPRPLNTGQVTAPEEPVDPDNPDANGGDNPPPPPQQEQPNG